MKRYLTLAAIATLSVLLFLSAKNMNSQQQPSKVEIKSVDGKYNFYVNGQLFQLKGAGGGGNLELLYKSGGNAIRSWGFQNGKQILDSAFKYNLMVAMGIGMGQELHKFDYNDTAAVGKQYRRNIAAIESLKNHPALLCWVVGNELNLSPQRNVPVNPKVYDALKDVVDYIHKNDPNHPVTTAFAGVNREQIRIALERCPNLDFISLQVYGSLGKIPEMAKNAGITIPYAITEYGPVGHWEMPSTKWGREIEETSAVKASGLRDRIQKGLVSDPSWLNLGGFAFLWGQKQERTPTWYGMFIKTGESTAVVDELTRYWTGNYPQNRAPQVDSIKLDGKRPVESVFVKPGVTVTANVFASDPNNDALSYRWVIQKEVIERSEGGAREIEPASLPITIVSDKNGELKLVTPAEPGEYRLFSYVFDGKKKVGTANIPFIVN
jgi:hypothetical protein